MSTTPSASPGETGLRAELRVIAAETGWDVNPIPATGRISATHDGAEPLEARTTPGIRWLIADWTHRHPVNSDRHHGELAVIAAEFPQWHLWDSDGGFHYAVKRTRHSGFTVFAADTAGLREAIVEADRDLARMPARDERRAVAA